MGRFGRSSLLRKGGGTNARSAPAACSALLMNDDDGFDCGEGSCAYAKRVGEEKAITIRRKASAYVSARATLFARLSFFGPSIYAVHCSGHYKRASSNGPTKCRAHSEIAILKTICCVPVAPRSTLQAVRLPRRASAERADIAERQINLAEICFIATLSRLADACLCGSKARGCCGVAAAHDVGLCGRAPRDVAPARRAGVVHTG
jgi:hypothetical protein